MRLKILFLIAVLLCAVPLFAVSIPFIDGWVLYSNGQAAGYAHVLVCSGTNCRGDLTNVSDGSFHIASMDAAENLPLNFYVWIDTPDGGRTGQWGSDTDVAFSRYPCDEYDQFGHCISHGIIETFTLYPRPFAPTLVSPANGASNVPLNGLVLNWTDGSDAQRAGYQMVYDIYASGYGIAPRLYASNVPCNGRGTCTYYVQQPLDAATYYRWFVKAKLAYTYNKFLTRDSAISSFTTAGTSAMTFSFRTYYGYWLSAQYGGGGNVNGTATGIGSNEKFKIIDMNGGDLLNGDQVELIAPNGMFVSAVNGGGLNVMANVTNPGANEIFTVVKMNNGGAGVIVSGDSIALRSAGNYYVVAEGGGGSDVNCNRTTAAQWETFMLNVNP